MRSELESGTQRVLRAFRYAAIKHRYQTLSDGQTPYFSHVVRVTFIVRDLFDIDDQDIIVATILHDVVEDTGTSLNEIDQLFGRTIAYYVEALTKNEALPRRRREQEYDERLFNAPEIVQIAKLADMYDNLSARIGTPKLQNTLENARRITAGFEKTIRTRRGKNALRHVRVLIAEIEDRVPSGAEVAGAKPGNQTSQYEQSE
ncbi:MAG TPA: HD domain-containing protein [Chthoniobacterales bacterium]|nr:HD domain-containing protein [Chthoniobacterales bacterium]